MRTFSAVLALVTCLALPAAAAPPLVLVFEGELAFTGEGPVDDLVPMTFRIHASPEEAADILWETSMPVEVIAGLFVVELGAAAPLPPAIFDAGPRYLAVLVGDPAEELHPRQQIGGAPYALVAAQASSLTPSAVQEVSAAVGTRLAQDPAFADVRATLSGSLLSLSEGVLDNRVAAEAGGEAAVEIPSPRPPNGQLPPTLATADVPVAGALERLDVELQLDHATPSELSIELQAPWGEAIVLHAPGTLGDPLGLYRTYSTQSGAPGQAALAPVVGRNPAGRWTLRMRDTVANRVDTPPGTLRVFRLHYDMVATDRVVVDGKLIVEGRDVAALLDRHEEVATGYLAGAVGEVLQGDAGGPFWGPLRPAEFPVGGCLPGQMMKVRAEGRGWECADDLGGLGGAWSRGGNTITTVDSVGDVGRHNSVTIGADGLPVLAYSEFPGQDLRVAKCGNAACSAGNTFATVDSAGVVGSYTSVTIGADGLPIVSYLDFTNQDLKVAKCGNAACSAGNTLTTVDSAGSVGNATSVAIGTDGLPFVAHLDRTNFDLKVAKCGNAACSAGNTLTTVDSAGGVGLDPSVAISTDGLPIVAYCDVTNGDLKVAKCGNAACSAGNTLTTVDSAGNVSDQTSVTIGADGLPIVAYHDSTNGDLKVAKCGNAACSAGNTLTTVDSAGDVGSDPSLTIGADGLPVLSYRDVTNRDLRVTKCGNTTCSAGNTLTTVDSAGDVGEFTSVTIGVDGHPVVSYYDRTNGDLKVLKCGNPFCSPMRLGR